MSDDEIINKAGSVAEFHLLEVEGYELPEGVKLLEITDNDPELSIEEDSED
jgi:hypothetical protein